jgi:glycosyltransferase involved in cell wall biosynthesis
VTRDPAVSVLVPAYRGAPWIRAAVESALAQTAPDLEVLVVDDASGDATADVARAVRDPRVRVVENPRNLGIIGNWNRAIRLARAPLLKPLFQDDLLDPSCVERLVAALRAAGPDAGMSFCRRRVILDDPDDPASRTWWERFADLPSTRYGGVPASSPPRALFDPWARERFHGNWIGEPTCVLLRRDALATTGLFHVRMRQIADMDMWGRLAFHFAVGFVDEPLCAFRVHGRSATRRHGESARDWLDRLWMIEGLLEDRAIASAFPDLRRWRRHEWRHSVRRARALRPKDARLTPRRPAAGVREYLAWRARRALRLAPPLHPPLVPSRARRDPSGLGSPRADRTE